MKNLLAELAEGKILTPKEEEAFLKELADAYNTVERTKESPEHEAISELIEKLLQAEPAAKK